MNGIELATNDKCLALVFLTYLLVSSLQSYVPLDVCVCWRGDLKVVIEQFFCIGNFKVLDWKGSCHLWIIFLEHCSFLCKVVRNCLPEKPVLFSLWCHMLNVNLWTDFCFNLDYSFICDNLEYLCVLYCGQPVLKFESWVVFGNHLKIWKN